MKAKILLVSMFVITSYYLSAQSSNYKVVFDITSNDSLTQQAVVRQAELIRAANPDAQLEVVIYGQALSLITKDGARQAPAILNLIQNKNVAFKVCAVTMQRQKVTADKLLAGVQIVPDGIYEIVTKQQEGWGYIKVAH